MSKLFYDMNGQDKVVRIADIKELLSRYFASQEEAQAVGDLFLYVSKKKNLMRTEYPAEERVSA